MSGGGIDFDGIKAAAKASAKSLLPGWFPAGVWAAPGIFQVGSVQGEKGGSLKVWLSSGVWEDFATGESGDLIALRAAQLGADMGTAAKDIAATLGLEAGSPGSPAGAGGRDPRGGRDAGEEAGGPDTGNVYAAYRPIVPVPDDAPPFAAGERTPPIFNPRRSGDMNRRQGSFVASLVHPYRTADGALIGYVLRNDWTDRESGKPRKETPFVMWCVRPGGAPMWCRIRPDAHGDRPLPLYGLQLLAARLDAEVLVVEGEKACDAANAIFDRAGRADWTAIAWPGGASAVGKVDWSPLDGRAVAIWPDADRQVWPEGHAEAGRLKPRGRQPGWKAAQTIAGLLHGRAARVRVVDPDDDRIDKDGWDLADGAAAGWTAGDVADYIAAHATAWEPSRDRDGARGGGDGDGGGEDRAAARAIAEGCPFVPLGHRQGEYFVLSPAGELRSIAFGRMNVNGLESLTDGDMGWYYQHFSETDPRSGVVSLSVQRARRWIMRACRRKGLFDPLTPVRGRGVWNFDNAPLVHAGDAIWTEAEGWRRSGFVGAGAIYAAAPKTARPAAEPATEAEARALLAGFAENWNFREPWGPSMTIGFLGQCFLGQAPDWRAHLYCLAEAGSGKSWLTDGLKAGLGGAANPAMNNYTESFLRQSLNNEARAILLDEAEPGDQNGHRIKAVIELMRHMSGLEGATAGRGGADGKATSYHLAGAVWMASILQGRLTPQDRSRISTIRLAQLDECRVREGGRERALAFIKAMRAGSPRLWARALAGWPRFLENMAAWRSALARAGCSARLIDQTAVLFAARDMMLSDAATDPNALADEIDSLRPMLDEAIEESGAGAGGLECWTHLMTSPADVSRGASTTVARLVVNARGPSGGGAETTLENLGLRYFANYVHRRAAEPEERLGEGVAVSNSHVATRRLFRDTDWADGAWCEALATLPGARRLGKTMRIGAVPCKAVWVPAAHLPEGAPIDGGPVDDDDRDDGREPLDGQL